MPLTPGRYKAEITSIAVKPSQSSRAVMLYCGFFIIDKWDDRSATWLDVFSQQLSAEGAFCIVKADGSRHTNGIKGFATATGWDGDLRKLQAGSEFKPANVQIEVNEETYQDKVRLRAAWIHRIDSDPKARGGGKAIGIHGDELDGLANHLGNLLGEEPVAPEQPNVFDPNVDDGTPF